MGTIAYDELAGSEQLRLRTLRVPAGRTGGLGDATRDEVLFVTAGRGTIRIGGGEHAVEPETGVFVPAGERYELETDDGLVAASILIGPVRDRHAPMGETAVTAPLDEAEDGTATTSRTFRILFAPENGCTGATAFVGYIPRKRAPVHYHLYDEVIYVLDPGCVLHLGGETSEIPPGGGFHLAPRQEHCVENTAASDYMRVLGVFTPAGSPSAAYLS
jgi:quercetin dioxygenase-like cupin family protein